MTGDGRQRAGMLDEGLDVLVGLWSGQPFSYSGEHYQLQDVTFLPSPVQSPRVPIWVGGYWPNKKPMRRAARWDGVLPGKINADGTPGEFTPTDAHAVRAYINEHRSEAGPFDIIHGGMTSGDDPEEARAIIEPFAEAGATWWLESAGPWPALDLASMCTRIQQGPPRIDQGASTK
jgi:alkanesulfonate monooxygenase SsuD/methylene tetrahydromethanopterin reductase-like flavin-dependent oxidoreductase (luciferase family)